MAAQWSGVSLCLALMLTSALPWISACATAPGHPTQLTAFCRLHRAPHFHIRHKNQRHPGTHAKQIVVSCVLIARRGESETWRVAALGGPVEGSVAVLVELVAVCVRRQQQLHHLHLPRHTQRRSDGATERQKDRRHRQHRQDTCHSTHEHRPHPTQHKMPTAFSLGRARYASAGEGQEGEGRTWPSMVAWCSACLPSKSAFLICIQPHHLPPAHFQVTRRQRLSLMTTQSKSGGRKRP